MGERRSGIGPDGVDRRVTGSRAMDEPGAPAGEDRGDPDIVIGSAGFENGIVSGVDRSARAIGHGQIAKGTVDQDAWAETALNAETKPLDGAVANAGKSAGHINLDSVTPGARSA